MRYGFALVFLSVFMWSWLGILGKELYRMGLTPTGLVFFRVLIAWGALLPVALRRGWLSLAAAALPRFLFYSLFSVVLNYLGFYWALRWVPITVAIVVVYSYPAIVLFLERAFMGERVGPVEWGAAVTTLAGIFLLAGGYRFRTLTANIPGVALSLLTAFSIAVYNVFGKRLVREFDPWAVLFWGFSLGGIVLLGIHLGTGGGVPRLSPVGWGLLACLALFPTLASYGLYLVALGHLRAGHASLLATLEPLLAALWAHLLFGERLAPLQATGGALVVAAAAGVLWSRGCRRGG